MKHVLESLKMTCGACPSQWAGRTTDDRPVYIRYRHGYLSVCIGRKGADEWDAVGGKEIYGQSIGGGWDGVMSTPDMLRHASGVLTMHAEATP